MSEAADVIVVGYGFAGGIAALAASDAGASVLILEKQPDPGGISVCSAGGLRITDDADKAFSYLCATNAGTTPEPVLRVLAQGMKDLPAYAGKLCAPAGAKLGVRSSPANYPLPGYESFGFAYVDELPNFDPATALPHVRGAVAGARLFEVVRRNVETRPAVTLRLNAGVERLLIRNGVVRGVIVAGKPVEARLGVVLACGGFEADRALQLQHWLLKPVLSAAVSCNTGDGIRMGQAAGAGLTHMWHYHGSYGFRHPNEDYPFGIRMKRLPDWNPADGLRNDIRMSWILLDRDGRRFMNEYEPYMQDTGHRPFEVYDPVRQDFSRVPSLLLVDSDGLALYPLSAPTWHDRKVAARYREFNSRQFDEQVLFKANSLDAVAARFGIDAATLSDSVAQWNVACAAGRDYDFGRPGGSMMPIAKPPYYAASIWPIVSNTQGGLAHDERQRVLDAFGEPISGLFVAGELGSAFGHLYMSGGNIAECFVGGRIAGEEAARREREVLTA